jgi:hypothetical protein
MQERPPCFRPIHGFRDGIIVATTSVVLEVQLLMNLIMQHGRNIYC